MTTYKQMCETIVEADMLRDKNGNPPTATQVFNYSPTGELFMVHEWYEEAKLIIAARDLEAKRTEGAPPGEKP